MMYLSFVKPLFDYLFSFIALLLVSPVFIFIAILLLLANGGSPFFLQLRPGKNEKLFTIIKFKTMNNKTDNFGNLLEDKYRLTRVGKWVRATSLDEIPQLINVIKGDMSFIGPRPLLPEYLPLYNSFQKQRHLVKPGISGWAQVNGRNAISWDDKFEKDVFYVQNVTFALDFKILLKTLKKVFIKENISAKNHATVERFKGNLK